MTQAIEFCLELLWRNALGVIPLALAVAAITRLLPTRASTRHALWVAALVGFLAPPLLPGLARFGPPTAAEVAERAATPTPSRTPSGHHDALASERPAPVSGGVEAPTMTETVTPTARVLTTPRVGAQRGSRDAHSLFEQPAARAGTELRSLSTRTRTPAETAIAPALRTAEPPAAGEAAPSAPKVVDGSPTGTSDKGAGQLAGVVAGWATDWQVTLLALREALVSMPHIPAHVWLLGAGVALVIGCGRALWFRRLLSRGDAAPAEIEQMVAGASARLGLRRTPRTVLVDDRITPMVWCGRRARLVLPRSLWDELDSVGRASVVHHELAHLKRKDHWVCWVEAFVGLLYWWHPVAWWVRRRIREEADICCDAWVTALLPQHRRAYAQALVSTRQYISEHGTAAPANGLGVMSNRGRRFARRLLMIMTNSHKPSLSTMGRMLALGVACAGILASPVLACPPEEKAEKAEAKQTEPAPEATESADDRSTFEQFMEDRESGAAEPTDERSAKLDALRAKLAEQREAAEADGEICASEEAKIAAIGEEIALVAETARALSTAPALTYVQSSGEGASTFEQWAQGETFERTYTLSDPRKLELLTALLVREDVPLLVRPHDDGITVIGTAAQHERFGAFIKLIDGADDVQRVYNLPEGRLDALSELMVLSTVPVLVRPEDDGLRVWGSDLDHEVFAGFMTLLGGDDEGMVIISQQRQRTAEREHAEHEYAEAEGDDDCSKGRAEIIAQREAQRAERDRAREEARRQHELAREMQTIERETVREIQAIERQMARTMHEAEKHEQKAREVEMKSAQLEQQSAVVEAHAEQLEAQAELISEQAEQIEEQAEEMEEEAAGDAMRKEADLLHEKSEEVLEEAEKVREKAERLLEKADQLRDEADELRDRANEIREEAEEMHERIEEVHEEREEAVARIHEEHASTR